MEAMRIITIQPITLVTNTMIKKIIQMMTGILSGMKNPKTPMYTIIITMLLKKSGITTRITRPIILPRIHIMIITIMTIMTMAGATGRTITGIITAGENNY